MVCYQIKSYCMHYYVLILHEYAFVDYILYY